jgi:hypothetical protein
MPVVQSKQLDALGRGARENFLLECISDWYALREKAYGAAPRLPFASAWAIGEHLWDRVEMLANPPGRSIEYSLIHTVLQCGERGAAPAQLRRGIETYCRSLPSHDAGLILLEALCVPDPAASA